MTLLRSVLPFFTILSLFVGAPLRAANDDPKPLESGDIVWFLDQSIGWYRDVTQEAGSQTRAGDVLISSTLKQNALRALRYSFDFARIEAELIETNFAKLKAQEAQQAKQDEKPVDTDSETDEDGQPNMARIKVVIEQKIARIKNDQAAVQRQLGRANAAQRTALLAKRDKLMVEMQLADAQQELVNTVSAASPDESDDTLSTQIEDLARAIPELAKKKKTATATSATAATTTDADKTTATQLATSLLTMKPIANDEEKKVEAKGIVRLVGDLIDLVNQRQDVNELVDATKGMRDANEAMLSRVRAELVAVVQRANAIGQDGASLDAAALNAQRDELTQLTARFKDLSRVIMPLSDQKKVLETATRNVGDWQNNFSKDWRDILARLTWRLFGLAIAIVIPLLLSEALRRANLKYVHDARRRRQLNIMRRIFLFILIGFVVILNLMTEFGSLATFIGFVTAGLAVALQNVILSIVAYFFFFGRYGIRVGSRVTVYGTTGEVIETGLVRLYLMELAEEDGKWQATGRIVAFPNSILFQPTAFFKQVPGAKFQQHEMTFWLEPDTDRAIANQKLKEAANAVYEDSRPMLEIQKIALEQKSHIKAKIPRPKGQLIEEDGRLGFMLRYPVAADRADNIDENAIRIVSDILEREPKLKRLNNDPPRIK